MTFARIVATAGLQVLQETDNGNKMDVLLVAVKKEIVNSYAEAIEEAGLAPMVMDVDYFALENMYEANYGAEAENGVVGIIHIGAQYTSITLLQKGISTFTGDLSLEVVPERAQHVSQRLKSRRTSERGRDVPVPGPLSRCTRVRSLRHRREDCRIRC